ALRCFEIHSSGIIAASYPVRLHRDTDTLGVKMLNLFFQFFFAFHAVDHMVQSIAMLFQEVVKTALALDGLDPLYPYVADISFRYLQSQSGFLSPVSNVWDILCSHSMNVSEPQSLPMIHGLVEISHHQA